MSGRELVPGDAYSATEFADPSERLAYRLQEREAENDRLRVKLADCQQLAKGEQSLLDSLREQAAEVQALRDALALTAVELAEVRKERDRAVERLERAGIL